MKRQTTRQSRKQHIRSYQKGGETWFELTFSLMKIQVRKKGFASYDIAEEEYNRIRSKIRAGEWTNFNAHSLQAATLSEFYEVYCDTRGNKRSPSSIENTRRTWTRAVDPILGSIRVRDISRRHLTMFVREQRLLGLTDNTIKTYAAEINNVLMMAVDLEVLKHFPKWPKLQPVPERKAILSPVEVMEVINAVDQAVSGEQYKTMILVQYSLGLRLGELLALTPGKFNLEAGTVLIDQQKLVGRGFNVGPTKTKNSVELPLSPTLIEELAPYVEDRDPNVPLWISLQLLPVCRNAYKYALKMAVEKSGTQKKVTSHVLRASCADYLVNKTSLSIMQVSHYMRHSPQVLVSRYAGADTAGLASFFSSKMALTAELNSDMLASNDVITAKDGEIIEENT